MLLLMLGGAATARAQAQLQIAPGTIATFAGGSGTCPGSSSPIGDGCPAATNANLQRSTEIGNDGSAGNVYVVDHDANLVRIVDANGTINTFAGGGGGCPGQTNAI